MQLTLFQFVTAGIALLGIGAFIGSKLPQQKPDIHAPWAKDQWDEFQETMMIAAALILYGGFEIMCFLSSAYADAPHTNSTRMALVTIVTNLFTFKFTKSLPSGGNGGSGTKGATPNE